MSARGPVEKQRATDHFRKSVLGELSRIAKEVNVLRTHFYNKAEGMEEGVHDIAVQLKQIKYAIIAVGIAISAAILF